MRLLALVLLFLFAVTQGSVLKDDEEAAYQAARATMDPKKVVTIGDRVYYINAISQVSVGLAALLCNDLGMVLVSFETLEEYHLVSDYIRANETIHYYYITSGNEYNDRWIWSGSGQVITDFEWAPNNPNGPNALDSSIVFGVNEGWGDLYADLPHYFVCEQKK